MASFWVFPGQGAQQVGMGRAMAERHRAAAAVYEEAGAALGYDLARVCWEGPEEELRRTRVTQPALVATCLACMAPLWERGARPDLLAGHSVGEYAALIAAGALSLADGLRLLARRGELMEAAGRETPGGMAAVLGLPTEAVEALAGETGVSLANRNAPGQVILSGPAAALERAMTLAKERGARRVLPLNVSGAFHSPCMAGAAAAFAEEIARAPIRRAEVPVIANLTAEPVQEPEAIRAALSGQLAGSVRWEESVRRAIQLGAATLVELGPGGVLAGLARRIDPSLVALSVADPEGLDEAAGQLLGSVTA
jgi:[acyl-carrier-protein] S-malonyltransferase